MEKHEKPIDVNGFLTDKMSLKELKDAAEKNKLVFGIRQVLKAGRGKKKPDNVFVAKDARDGTIKKLEDAGVEFEVLKTKEDISKELGLDFESEVYFIR